MKLSDEHRKQLIDLLERRLELATEEGRRNILTSAGLREIAPKIDLSGSQSQATTRIVNYLEDWGRLASQKETLGLFLSTIKDLKSVGIEQRDFLNFLLKEYEMMKAIAPDDRDEQPELPGQNQTLGQEGKLSIKEIKAETANIIDRTVASVGKNYNEDSQNINNNSGIVIKELHIGSDPQPEVSGEPEPEIQWRDICRQMLEEQKHLTTNDLMRDEEDRFELDEIHVPLALVERKKPEKRDKEFSPEQGSRLYEPEYEEKQRFQHQQFLTDILGGGKGKSQGKRIAIIGEPGAGKTTLARKIAFWILDNTTSLPILIAAADLPEPEANRDVLEEYLLEKWLKNAVERVADLTEGLEVKFKKKFRQGKVWLLLDGIDEMPARRLEPLRAIQNQLSGWVGQERVVLTCRLNLWEANRNALASEFEIYRTLEFSYGDGKTGDQVGEFIGKWFQREPELGEKLRREMERSEKRRIKDLAKNPLRLALLCSTWRLWKDRGGLPDTKAKLYKGFVDKFSAWKQEEFPSTPTERRKLNKALGELARVAIDRDESRFRLKQSLVSRVLEQEGDRLFELATKLGWLNKVGLAAESPDEEVYAFYHPTFQEYFAATAIEDWHFFLNHVPDEPEQGNYRIFEPQWKQVILLWLGREDVRSEQKEQFIEALVSFEDKCNDFYKYRAYFLAAAGIAEFKQCRRADEIIKQLIEWIVFRHTRFKESDTLPIISRVALKETDNQRAISALVHFLNSAKDKDTLRKAFESLREIGAGNSKAIYALVQLLNSTKNKFIRREAVDSLVEIGTGNSEAISAMVQLLNSAESENTRRQAACSLGKIGKGNSEAIYGLVELLNSTEDEFTRREAVESLREIGAGNSKAIYALEQLLNFGQNEYTCRRAAESLWKIEPGNSQAISAIVHLIHDAHSEFTRRKAVESLGRIDPGNSQAISALVQLLNSTKSQSTRRRAAESLLKIDPGNFEAISALVQLVSYTKYESNHKRAFEGLGKFDPGSSETISALVQLLNSTDDQFTQLPAAELLGKIGADNSEARSSLVQLANYSKHKSSRTTAAYNFQKISSSPSHCVPILKLLRGRIKNKACYRIAWHCAENLSYPDFYRAWHQGVPTVPPEESTTIAKSLIAKTLIFFKTLFRYGRNWLASKEEDGKN